MNKMNRLLLMAVAVYAAVPVWAANVVTATSDIKRVIVYQRGAMVNRQASVNLQQGVTEVKIPMLTPNLDQRSLQVGVTNDAVTLVSVKYDVEVPDKKQIAGEVNTLSNRTAQLRDSIKLLTDRVEVLNNERNLIVKSDNIGGNQGFNAQTLSGVAAYLRKDLNEVSGLQFSYNAKIQAYQKELTLLSQKVNLLYEKQTQPMSYLMVTLTSKSAATSDLSIQYMVDDATWTPFYEIRIADAQPLRLISKANVNQNSKEKWNEVSLALSQSDPMASNEKPVLGKYTLPDPTYTESNRSNTYQSENVKVLGVVRDDKAPLQGALVTCGDRKTQTDANGYYELLVPNDSRVIFSYAGYEEKSDFVRGQNVKVCNINMNEVEDNVSRQEMIGYRAAAPAQNEVAFASKRKLMKMDAVTLAVAEDEAPVEAENNTPAFRNYTANVQGKYSVPDDGADHEVSDKTEQVDAEYSFYCVPKLSNNVYLVASIPDWKKYDLQSGKTKLFMNNVYMGDSYINAESTDDTLKMSVGVSKQIVVERKEIKNYTTKNIIKSSRKVERNWQITVSNNKPVAAEVVVDDQYPVSNNEEVKVELLSNGGAEVNESEGKLTWKLKLAAGEKKVISFSYSVKYPKDMEVNVE